MMFTLSAGNNCFIILKLNFFASLLFRLINANISVNEQPEWPFYTYLRHVHVLDHGHFIDIVSALAIKITVPPVIRKKLMTGKIEKTRNLGFIS